MRLVRPTLVSVLAVALATSLLTTVLTGGPASAQTDAQQGARRTRDHFPASITSTVPAGGSSLITTPTLGKNVKSVKVTVQPGAGATPDEEDVYDRFVNSMGSLSKGRRLLVCVMVYQAIAAPEDDPHPFYGYQRQVSASRLSVAGAVLLACLQLAGLLQSGPPARPLHATRAALPAVGRAGTGCGQARPSLPATVTKTEDGYTVQADGTTKKARHPKLRVGCQVRGDKVIYNIRAAKKGLPLRRVVGKNLMVGIQSPPDASTSVPVKVTFATP